MAKASKRGFTNSISTAAEADPESLCRCNELQRYCNRLGALVDLQLGLVGSHQAEALTDRLLHAAGQIVPAPYLAIRLEAQDAQDRVWLRSMGFQLAEEAEGELIARAVAQDQVVSAHAAAGIDAAALPPGVPAVAAALAAPIRAGGKPRGWMFMARTTETGPFDQQDEQLAAALARSAAQFLDNALAHERAERQLRDELEQRQRSETAYRRLRRVHRMRSYIASQIMRIRDQQELFEEVCRTAQAQGGFRFAAIGVFRDGVLDPVAAQGDGNADLASLGRLRLDATPTSPALEPFRTRQPYVCNDLEQDLYMAPWRVATRRHGVRSVAVFPLYAREELAGCLCLYAEERDFFTEEESQLLGELASDISYALEFIAREEQLDFLSYYDPVTGLANRNLFNERLNQHVLTARQNGTQLAIAVIDLEQFKLVNDTYGMAAGDDVLRHVADRLVRFTGNPSYLARVGGDRFAAVIPELRDTSGLAAMLQDRFLTRLTRPIDLGGRSLRLSGKVGIALFPGDGDDAESLFRNSEAALKKAKEAGERFLFYTAQMGAAMKRKLELESQLRNAIELQQFRLYYQPKIDLRTGSISGCEALLRWNSPELGMVPPAQFVPILEETRLIIEVGRWALEQAAQDRAEWMAQGLPVPPVCVNVSPIQLRDAQFISTVRNVLDQHEVDTNGLTLEITESALMSEPDATIEKLRLLRTAGVSIALDDFGTGYSSLAYLAKLPLNTLKIDRSFIVRMTDSADTMSIVSTIVSLAHSMNLTVVAEGVDATEQLKFLRLLKCDEMQGFLFSPAVPADEYASYLRTGRRLKAG